MHGLDFGGQYKENNLIYIQEGFCINVLNIDVRIL